MHQTRWYSYWRRRRSLLSYLLMYVCWTSLFGRRALCNPLLRDTSPSDHWSDGSGDQWSGQAEDSTNRIEQVRKTVDTVQHLRQMLSERLLAGGAAKTGENFKFSGSTPSLRDEYEEEENTDDKHRQNFVLVAATDDKGENRDHHFVLKRADPDTEIDPSFNNVRHQNRKEDRQRRQRQRTRTLIRNQKKLTEESELEEFPMQDDPLASYPGRVPTFQINANIQPPEKIQALRHVQRQRQEESQRFLAVLAKPDHDCPKQRGGAKQVLCPSRGRRGYRVCIPDSALCNGHSDCPNGEDEDSVNCLFYKTTIHHFQLIVDAVVELSDMVKRHDKMHTMDEL